MCSSIVLIINKNTITIYRAANPTITESDPTTSAITNDNSVYITTIVDTHTNSAIEIGVSTFTNTNNIARTNRLPVML